MPHSGKDGKPISQNLRCNEQIRISPVRVVNAENAQLGVLPTHEALRLARDAGLDLVEVAPNDRPPVCRVMDYGKWKYAQKKKQKKHFEQQLKEVRLRPKTDTHDRQVKVKHAIDFLREGHKVQFTMKFRGRERSHRDIGAGIFHSILEELGPFVKVERPPSMEGRDMIMIMVPNKQALDKLTPPAKPAGASAAPQDAQPPTGPAAAESKASIVDSPAGPQPAMAPATSAVVELAAAGRPTEQAQA